MKRLPLRNVAAMLAVVHLVAVGGASAETDGPLRVIEETAIPFTSFLGKEEFDERFPGERVPSVRELETGWYVVYRHEALNYHFGPVLLESTGRDYLGQLRATVEAAVERRPSITGYVLQLRYLPDQPPPDADSPEPGDAPPPGGGGPPPAQPPGGLFEFLRRLFGF